MSAFGLSAMGSTLAERKAFREAHEAAAVEPEQTEAKAVESSAEMVENKAVARKRTSRK